MRRSWAATAEPTNTGGWPARPIATRCACVGSWLSNWIVTSLWARKGLSPKSCSESCSEPTSLTTEGARPATKKMTTHATYGMKKIQKRTLPGRSARRFHAASPVRRQRHVPGDHGSAAWCGRDVERASERRDAVDHVAESRSGAALPGIESAAVVAHRELEGSALLADVDHDFRSRSVLGRVVQRLEAGEVDRGFDFDWVSADSLVVHRHLDDGVCLLPAGAPSRDQTW